MTLMVSDHEHGNDQLTKNQLPLTAACQLKPSTTACLCQSVNQRQKHHPLVASSVAHVSSDSHRETNSIDIW